QRIEEAAASDASGQAAWGLTMEQASRDGRGLQMSFTLFTPDGPFMYTATGSLNTQTSDETGWTYTFVGTYAFYSGPSGNSAQMPRYGTILETLRLNVAQTSIEAAHVSLQESTS